MAVGIINRRKLCSNEIRSVAMVHLSASQILYTTDKKLEDGTDNSARSSSLLLRCSPINYTGKFISICYGRHVELSVRAFICKRDAVPLPLPISGVLIHAAHDDRTSFRYGL